ncbi:MAG: hypothetical protein K2W95_18485 [Candidatus Obscuribacterales bacterium]|nr:hypothetical protein [Candidatus Obscuribacterales bacterium]
MVQDYRILDSARKHGITDQEIDYVLSDKNPTQRAYEMHDDDDGNAQDMFVAHTGTRPWPIEVGLSYRAKENIVFHANKVTPEYEKLYKAEP